METYFTQVMVSFSVYNTINHYGCIVLFSKNLTLSGKNNNNNKNNLKKEGDGKVLEDLLKFLAIDWPFFYNCKQSSVVYTEFSFLFWLKRK